MRNELGHSCSCLRVWLARYLGSLLMLAAGIWLVIAQVGTPGVSVLAPAARSADLLARATFLAHTSDWWGERFCCGIGVQWVSDHELLHARCLGPNGRDRAVFRRDVRTGRERQLPGLTRALNSIWEEVIDSEALSPDGKGLARSARWSECLLTDAEGRRVHLYPADHDGCYRRVQWMPDSRHWVECFGVNGKTHRLFLHDVRRPALSRPILVDGPTGRFFSADRILSFDRAISILGPDPAVRVYELSRTAGSRDRRLASIRVSRSVEDVAWELSPRGDKIAWVLAVLLARGKYRLEVWVSRLDGSRMCCLGSLTEDGAASTAPAHLLTIQWLPSGRRLAFIWNDTLYTVPIE